MPEEKISLKDVLVQVSSMKGTMEMISKLAPIISQSEKEIIRLQEADKYLHKEIEDNKVAAELRLKGVEDSIASLIKEFKESRKTDQYILVAIGITAIGAQVLLPFIIS